MIGSLPRLLIPSLIVALGAIANASIQPSAKLNQCRRVTSLDGRRELIRSFMKRGRATHPDIEGGFFNLGLCWWKSRLARSALYLAYYSPEKPIPTREQALDILRHVILQDKLVEIPGFSTFFSFTGHYREEVRTLLEEWQKRDSFVGAMRTINPIRPTFFRQNRNQFEDIKIMHEMLTEHGAMPFVMIQYPGVKAHSLLIHDVQPVLSTSFPATIEAYEVLAIDPSWQSSFAFTVRPGDRVIHEIQGVSGSVGSHSGGSSKGMVLPSLESPIYPDFMIDLTQISRAIRKSCPGNPGVDLNPSHKRWGSFY